MAVFDRSKHTKTKERLAALNVEDSVLTVPLRKPQPSEWVMAWGNSLEDLAVITTTEQQDAEGNFVTYMLQPKDDETEKLLVSELQPIKSAILALMINTYGKYFIWPCKQPGASMREMAAHISGRRAIEKAQQSWVKIGWDNAGKEYSCKHPLDIKDFEDPQWPNKTYDQLISQAYSGDDLNLIIEDTDHRVFKNARSRSLAKEKN